LNNGYCQAKWYPFQTTKSENSNGNICPIKTIFVSACREGPICDGFVQQKSFLKKGRGSKFKNAVFFRFDGQKIKKNGKNENGKILFICPGIFKNSFLKIVYRIFSDLSILYLKSEICQREKKLCPKVENLWVDFGATENIFPNKKSQNIFKI
jgi:hypothetical protein